MAIKGYEPRMSFDTRLVIVQAKDLTDEMSKVYDFVKESMAKAQEKQKADAWLSLGAQKGRQSRKIFQRFSQYSLSNC